jgi:hypothetical protein
MEPEDWEPAAGRCTERHEASIVTSHFVLTLQQLFDHNIFGTLVQDSDHSSWSILSDVWCRRLNKS